MVTLCMDTSHKYLALCLINDDRIIGSVLEECFKKQSEEIFPRLIKMLDDCGLKSSDIEAVCISEGPGSYTGVRIAMTIAKVMCSLKKLPLYTISTLRLYANNKPNAMVLLDARSKRVYKGIYNCGEQLADDTVIAIDDITNFDNYEIIGDGSLIGKSDFYYDVNDCFLNTKKYWKLVDEVHTLTPVYLKSVDDYMVKK